MENGFYLLSKSQNPYYNQAVTEYLFNCAPQNYICMVIHRENLAVSVGGNFYFPNNEGKLQKFRRLTGGGIVLHLPEIMAVSFITARETADFSKQTAVISLALKTLGIKCNRINNSVLIGKEKALINLCDKSGAIARQDSFININAENKGNMELPLSLANYGIKAQELEIALISAFQALYKGAKEVSEDLLDIYKINELASFFASSEWIYSGKLKNTVYESFAWGELILNIEVENGVITKANIFSNSEYSAIISLISEKLYACPCLISAIKNRILSLPYANSNMHIVRDVLRLVEKYLAINSITF